MRDRVVNMNKEDLFVLMTLFDSQGSIDYRAILDESTGKGILQHVTRLPVPLSTSLVVVVEKPPTKDAQRSFNEPFRSNHSK
jgi:hypothetical protein